MFDTSNMTQFNILLMEYSELYKLKMTQMMQNNNTNVDRNLDNKLLNLNNKLTTLAIKMILNIEKLSITDLNNQMQHDTYKNNLLQQLNNLKNEKKGLSTNLEGIKADSTLKLQSSHIKYLTWVFLCITIIILLIHSYASRSVSYIVEIVIFIIVLIALYNFLIYFSNKLS